MKAVLVRHIKVLDELDNTVEIKVWSIPEPTLDKPHGYKYSFVYIAGGKRVIGYDNADGKGDHRHYGKTVKPYKFKGIDKLFEDFNRDIRRFKREG